MVHLYQSLKTNPYLSLYVLNIFQQLYMGHVNLGSIRPHIIHTWIMGISRGRIEIDLSTAYAQLVNIKVYIKPQILMQKLEVIALVVMHIRLLKRQKSNGPCPSPIITLALRRPNS